jgi:hypothetical protein
VRRPVAAGNGSGNNNAGGYDGRKKLFDVREETPLRKEPFEFLDSAIFEGEPGCLGKCLHLLRNENLVRRGPADDACRLVQGDAPQAVADELQLADVDPGAHPQSVTTGCGLDVRDAAHSGRRRGEGRQHAVAHRLDFTAAEAFQNRPYRFIVPREKIPPVRVADASERLGRTDERLTPT